MQRVTFVYLLFLTATSLAKLPSNFVKCSRNTDDFKQCLTQSVGEAVKLLIAPVPELGLPSFEPLLLSNLNALQGQKITEHRDTHPVLMHGLTNISVWSFDFDFKKKHLLFGFLIPDLFVEQNFDIDGRIFGEDIRLKGELVEHFERTTVSITAKYEEYIKKRKKYVKIAKTSVVWLPGLSSFRIESDQDTTQAKHLIKILYKNFKDKVEDPEDRYDDVLGNIFKEYFNKVFSKISISELFES